MAEHAHRPDLGQLRRLEVYDSWTLYEVDCRDCEEKGSLVIDDTDVEWLKE